jgi:mRNA interferase RelE/StbE
MAVKFRKQAVKFLQKADSEDVARIQEQLSQLLMAIEEQGVIPFTELDIKKMKGQWEGFYRCQERSLLLPPRLTRAKSSC